MNNKDINYAEFVGDLFKDMGDEKANLLHAAVGISGEAGELLDSIKKHWAYGKDLDVNHVVEELGDILFYLQAMLNQIGVSAEYVVSENIYKLNKRYPTGAFSSEQAIARADKNDPIKA